MHSVAAILDALVLYRYSLVLALAGAAEGDIVTPDCTNVPQQIT